MISEPQITTAAGKALFIAGILLFSLCWNLSTGLNGDFWYLTWFAPIPVLIIAFKYSWKITFITTFIGCLAGRMSYFVYLLQVASITVAIVVTLALSFVFALIILLTRRAVLKLEAWYAIFAFPALFTAFEFLLFKFSADGTSASLAYSQSNFLPVIQIASVTGILGITFIVTLVPSAIATAVCYEKKTAKRAYILLVTFVFVAAVLIYGSIRLNVPSNGNTVKAGLVVLEESVHNASGHQDFKRENLVTARYIGQVHNLAKKGAEIIILPEKVINIYQERAKEIVPLLCNAAKENHIYLIAGYVNNVSPGKKLNAALVIGPKGDILIDYNKVFLVTGWERNFTKGNQPGFFSFAGKNAGVAICKDLDFPEYIRQYGKSPISFLVVPAWDFITDDWLHSRMAILRGIENGFSIARTARQGRLTISDSYGRVTEEVISADQKQAVLIGDLSLERSNTIYSKIGDWFGIVDLIAAAFIILIFKKQKVEVQ